MSTAKQGVPSPQTKDRSPKPEDWRPKSIFIWSWGFGLRDFMDIKLKTKIHIYFVLLTLSYYALSTDLVTISIVSLNGQRSTLVIYVCSLHNDWEYIQCLHLLQLCENQGYCCYYCCSYFRSVPDRSCSSKRWFHSCQPLGPLISAKKWWRLLWTAP